MKIKTLIEKLNDLSNKNGNVVIYDEGNPYDFSGIGVDDRGDVELYIAGGDKKY
jgi:hypothetical protein